MKAAIGLILGFLIGAGCRLFDLPLPAPLALVGALLVVAMTSGYVLTDRYLAKRPAKNKELCGGPAGTGQPKQKS